jgi:hypothetical protein
MAIQSGDDIFASGFGIKCMRTIQKPRNLRIEKDRKG